MSNPTPDDPDPNEQLYLLLTDLFYLLDDTDRQFFGEFGLSTRQFWALHHLRATEDLPMIELSRRLFTDKSNVTAIADRLEAAGLIERRASPQDRRVILLSLTQRGAELYEQALAAHQQRIRALMGSDEADLRQVIHILESIRVRFAQHLRSNAQLTPTS